MFVYEKRLEYPINIKNPNPKLAAAIISQYGGPDGNRIQKMGPRHCVRGPSCWVSLPFSWTW